MSSIKKWVQGRHVARLEQPDVVVVRFEGPVQQEDAEWNLRIYQEVAAAGPFFAIVETVDSAFDAGARRYVSQHLRREWFRGAVLVGAGLLERAAFKSILVGLYLTGAWDMFPEFVDTQAEALVAVEQMRQKQAHKAAAVPPERRAQ